MSDTPRGPSERLEAARAVVYDDAGELLAPEEIDDALEAYGVTVTTGDDGTPEYRDVPPELSLSACFLAVDLQQDPAAFLSTPDTDCCSSLPD